MKKQVSSGILKGTVFAPSSKSYSQRAILAASLASGISIIDNLGQNKDSEALISALQTMGITFSKDGERLSVNGGLDLNRESIISIGESGLASRLMLPILSLGNRLCTITGEGTILGRKMDFTRSTLDLLGVSSEFTNGCLPIKVKGPVKPCKLSLDCSESSQFLSGLLFALPMACSDSEISVRNLASKPYIQITIDVLKRFGIKLHSSYEDGVYHFFIPGNQHFSPANYTIEGDWSGASTLLVAPGRKTIRGLNIDSSQADKSIISVIKMAGLNVYESDEDVTVFGRATDSFCFDATDCPDLFPALAVLAVRAPGGVSEIIGTSRLVNKESNRLHTIKEQFGKMGISIDISCGNRMLIPGGQKPIAAEVESCSDHRIAMALASLALMAEGTTVINSADAVNKSYKNFWNDFNALYSYE